MSKNEQTANLLKRLLAAGIPLSDMPSFPKMGSYSGINNVGTKEILLSSTRDLYGYRTREEEEDALPSRQTQLQELHDQADTFHLLRALGNDDGPVADHVCLFRGGTGQFDLWRVSTSQHSG